MSRNTYITHWNGARPYIVKVKKFMINVYESEEEDAVIVFNAPFKQLVPGRSVRNKMTEYSGGHGIDFIGNTILLVENFGENYNDYIFIGRKIFRFTSPGFMVKFRSPVGNNDIPYPFAKDDNGDIYLFNEEVIITSLSQRKHISNIYSYYYAHNTLPFQIAFPIYSPDGRLVERADPITVHYKPDPAKYILDLLAENNFDKDKPFLIKFKFWHSCTVESYIEKNNEFGDSKGFKPFSDYRLVHSSNC